jgi:hypothetical protein
VHRSNYSPRAVLRVIVLAAAAGAGLGAVAAGSGHALRSRDINSVSCAQLNPTGQADSEHYYYLPSEFKTPEGPVAEPIATF